MPEAVWKDDRREPLGNLLSLRGTAALRRLRMRYSKRNRITGFCQSSEFSHGLAPFRTSVARTLID
jgi:hypothetical protein